MCEMWGLNRTTLRAAIRRLTEMGSLFFLTGIARDYNNVPVEFFKSVAPAGYGSLFKHSAQASDGA